MTETTGTGPRRVRRARVRMTRPRGRKGARAMIIIATFEAHRVLDAIRRKAARERAEQSRRGLMPHKPRARPRERLKPHIKI